MIETKKCTIDGVQYEATTFTGSLSLRMFARVMGVFSAPIAKMLEGVSLLNIKNMDDLIAADVLEVLPSVGEAFTALTDKLPPEELVDLCKAILANTRKSNGEINFDMDFAGNLLHLFKVVKFVLEANYADFFVLSLKGKSTAKSTN